MSILVSVAETDGGLGGLLLANKAHRMNPIADTIRDTRLIFVISLKFC